MIRIVKGDVIMQNALEVSGLRKKYGQVNALDGVDFEVRSGEIFGLLGPNGAGKTTTVECLLGLRRPDAGELSILGMKHPQDSAAIKTRIGAQLQTTAMYPNLKVRELLQLFGDLFSTSRPADELIELLGLQEKAGTLSKNLSGGQRQRLAVALALVNNPDLIFLDEPTTGLDPQARRSLWDVIEGQRQQGKTVLLTTHYMEEAERLCDRVAVMDQGRILTLDSPGALIHQYFKASAIEFVNPGVYTHTQMAALPAVNQVVFQNGHITLFSLDIPRTMAGLFELQATQDTGFQNMTVRQATLEDVFLKLTGRRIRS